MKRYLPLILIICFVLTVNFAATQEIKVGPSMCEEDLMSLSITWENSECLCKYHDTSFNQCVVDTMFLGYDFTTAYQYCWSNFNLPVLGPCDDSLEAEEHTVIISDIGFEPGSSTEDGRQLIAHKYAPGISCVDVYMSQGHSYKKSIAYCAE